MEIEIALTETCQGNRVLVCRQHRSLTGVVAPFIAIEKERLALNDRTADSATIGVANQRGPNNASVVVEPVIGRKNRVTVGFEGRTMPGVGARLGHQRDLGAGRPSATSPRVESGDAKFFDSFGVQAKNRSLFSIRNRDVGLGRANRVAVGLVDIHAIQRNVRLVSAASCDVTVFGYAGLQS